MNIRGAIFDLDGTLTDSMYIWQKAPVDLVRRYGGDPPEDLARDLKEMGRREAAEEMLAMRLAVLHNLYFYNKLAERIRQALDAGQFAAFRAEYSEKLAGRL